MVRDCKVGDMRTQTPLTNYRATFPEVAAEGLRWKPGRRS